MNPTIEQFNQLMQEVESLKREIVTLKSYGATELVIDHLIEKIDSSKTTTIVLTGEAQNITVPTQTGTLILNYKGKRIHIPFS